MCGIYGGIGKIDVLNRTIVGLKKLDYRGYDSAGIAFLKPCENLNYEIVQNKTIGDVLNLKEKLNLQDKKLSSNFNLATISHTRWATHGKVCEKNTHPHISYMKNFSIVHNGIIENYLEIKAFLKKQKVKFLSQTDTEVVAHLLEFNYAKTKNELEALRETCSKLKGSYALAVLCKSGKILLTKSKSPLFICIKQISNLNIKEVWFASDIAAFETSNENKYFSLFDGDFVMLNSHIKKDTEASLKQSESLPLFYNNNLEEIFPKPLELNNLEEISNSNNSFGFYMRKEINETEKVLEVIYNSYKNNKHFNNIKEVLKKANKIELIACGSAYHSCLIGSRIFMEEFNIEASAHIASEYIHKPKFIDDTSVCIFVSQSGETADTITCHNICKDLGATTIGIINSKHSTLASKCDYILPLLAGQEISVASTKAYSAMVYLFKLLGSNATQNLNPTYNSGLNTNIPSPLKINYEQFNKIVNLVKKQQFTFFFARGMDYFLASEAALKLRETSYIKAFSMPAGELKHGSIALIDNKTLSFVFCTQNVITPKILNAVEQIAARGGKVIIVSSEFELLNLKHKNIVAKYELPKTNIPEIYIGIFLQTLSLEVSLALGYNPDKPRNLAKAVSVE